MAQIESRAGGARIRRVVLRMVELGSENLEWSLRMIVASRCFERIGDHAVDIGEQAALPSDG